MDARLSIMIGRWQKRNYTRFSSNITFEIPQDENGKTNILWEQTGEKENTNSFNQDIAFWIIWGYTCFVIFSGKDISKNNSISDN